MFVENLNSASPTGKDETVFDIVQLLLRINIYGYRDVKIAVIFLASFLLKITQGK